MLNEIMTHNSNDVYNSSFKGRLSPSKNEHKTDKDLYCIIQTFVLIRFSQRNEGH